MSKLSPSLLAVLILSCSVSCCFADVSDAKLQLNIDREQISVSGISSGAQMAHQLHTAYPEIFSGAAMIAGAPFGCAGGALATAMTRCMGNVQSELPLAEFIKEIRLAEQGGKVGKLLLLADDPVWIFHGSLDTTVAGELSDAMVTLYREFIPAKNIRYVKNVEAAHNFPTLDQGKQCTSVAPPFIGNCDYDAAGELLQHLYGQLAKPAAKQHADLTETTLTETTLTGALAAGLSETAYLYIPTDCKIPGQTCKAHLVLHGCAQSSTQIGTTFIVQSGYLRWAEANDIVLAFPQVTPTAANPFACWDWWGYTGESYRWRDGQQMKLLADWMQGLIIE